MTPEEEKRVASVMEVCITQVQKGIETGDAASALEAIAKMPIADVRFTLLHTQPGGWQTLFQPLLESLTDEQAPAVLAAIVTVFIQAKANVFHK